MRLLPQVLLLPLLCLQSHSPAQTPAVTVTVPVTVPPPPLVTTAETFSAGKTYKLTPNAAERAQGKYDCTTFAEAVLRQAGYTITPATARVLNIVLAPADAAHLRTLVETRDPKIRGIAAALIQSGQGTEVTTLAGLKPGDVVQLWHLTATATATGAKGHCAIVHSVQNTTGGVTLIGAHNTTDGVGRKSFTLGGSDWPIWFAARPGALP